MRKTVSTRIAVIGIGNDLAGDDGAGLEVIRLLEPGWQDDKRVLLHRLEGDLLSVGDLLPLADAFIFVDAVAGSKAGELVRGSDLPRAFTPSFHQTDIALVMRSLRALKMAEPFPRWELWGITIPLPETLHRGLSPKVEKATRQLAGALDAHLRKFLNSNSLPDLCIRSSEDSHRISLFVLDA